MTVSQITGCCAWAIQNYCSVTKILEIVLTSNYYDTGSMVAAWIGTIALCTLFIAMMEHGGGSS